MPSIARSTVIAGLGVLLVLPVAAQEPERTRPAALEGSSVTWCGDIEQITAAPELYGDSPIYLGNPPTGKVQRWAKTKLGYQELWIDRDNLGWITVAFTEGVEERQAELERKFPDLGVVAVEVQNPRKELRKLQNRVGDAVFGGLVTSGGISAHVPSDHVELEVNVVTDELVAFLESEFAGEPLCLDGPDPAMIVQPGPQPTEGDGWQLVDYHQGRGPNFRTGIATDEPQLESLWSKAKMPGDVPEVDFIDNVVLWFAEPHGSSCSNLRLDDVIVDHDRSVIYPLIVMPDNPMACTSDLAGAYQYFVAFERERLPESPFWIQLDSDDPPYGAPKERTVVEVDLAEPGTVAAKGEVHFDREQRGPQTLRSGAWVEPRVKMPYVFDATCGIGHLGEINDIHWMTDEADVPEAWAGSIDEDGELVVALRLRGGSDPHATATANDHTVRYGPTREAPPDCDA